MSLISVIVPVYNSGKYLSRCIDSILAQTYKDLDVILLDDGSSDNSYEIMCQCTQKDSRVRAFKFEHKGVAYIRKKGIELAEGEFIGFVDSDDWIEPDMYSRFYEIMDSNKCELVSSDIYIHANNGDDWTVYDNYDRGLYTNLHNEIFPTMLHDFAMDSKGLRCYLVTKLFRADMLKKTVENIDARVFYSEDAMILYRYCLQCKSIYIMREYFYHYDIYAGAAETKYNPNEPNNMYWLFSNLKQAFETSPYADVLMPQLYQYAILLNSRVFRGLYGMDLTQINQWVFFDCEKLFGKRIVVYGAGTCGYAFCKDFWKNGHADGVVAWVDKNPKGEMKWEQRYIKEFQGTPLGEVQPVSVLKSLEYDYIAVTIRKESVANEAIRELQEVWDIPREKIVPVKSCKKNLYSMLSAAYM